MQEVIDGKRELIQNQSELRTLKRERNMYKDRFTKSVILNIALVAAIIAMVIITLTSKNPNIINYETNLEDKLLIDLNSSFAWISRLKFIF